MGSALLGTGKLTTVEQIVCYVLAALTIPVGMAAKKIPDTVFEWAENIKLEHPDEDDIFDQWHKRVTSGITRAQSYAANPHLVNDFPEEEVVVTGDEPQETVVEVVEDVPPVEVVLDEEGNQLDENGEIIV